LQHFLWHYEDFCTGADIPTGEVYKPYLLDSGEAVGEDGHTRELRQGLDTITPMRERQSRTVATGALTRTELIQEVARVLEISMNESATTLDAIFNSMVRAIQAGDRIEIRGFGSFDTRQRKARIGRNPKTGASVEVPPKRVVFFKPGKDLKEAVDQNSTPQEFRRTE